MTNTATVSRENEVGVCLLVSVCVGGVFRIKKKETQKDIEIWVKREMVKRDTERKICVDAIR